MKNKGSKSRASAALLPKCPTGIQGLDEITGGGLPLGRPTLVCGGAGCGKTLLAAEFLVRGAVQFDEPGVLISFEETETELKANVTSLGFDLAGLVRRKKILIDYVHIEPGEVHESGEYDLEGLFVRLNHAIDSIGAKRVVLDTLEALFAGLRNEGILRAELRRLFRWLKDKGVTAVITAERGRESLTRHGLEEYVSDCVILLDHRVTDQIATRNLRVVKYRGALHGTNEFPFLIGNEGISVLPITSVGLNHKISSERIATGIPRLDAMLGGRGFFRGSSILLTGTPGTGKTIVAANFAQAACRRGERTLFFSFEESPNQIIRNMHSIGLRLDPLVKRGLLRFHAARPSLYGLEMHLATMFNEIATFQPQVVIIDPITSLMDAGTDSECRGMVTRLVDYLKAGQVTTLFTSLTQGGHALQQSEAAMSSLMDSWLLLQDTEGNGERNRVLYVLKARGMAHSNQIREFLISNRGIDLVDAYIGANGVLTGSARAAQGALEKAAVLTAQQEAARRKREIERKRAAIERQISGLRYDYESEAVELRRIDEQVGTSTLMLTTERAESGRLRQADAKASTRPRGNGRNGRKYL
ncbi:circadian clock protein KaiC [Opitutus sp. GAS368]|uniref:circadian clock protein KaiC n=1 Tax=Opitutus sp. GAS368 TaxID=1882749 RepID=UPI00087B5699|nr:circadian clock protein KaiC [Opitutus sp. GAS368]SDS13099.1 circadian clock protein KaiC [Opitutus sp. GAS368]